MGHLRMRGVVCKIDTQRAFGFVRPVKGGEDLFFSLRDIPESETSVQLGSELEYMPLLTERGPRAAKPIVIRSVPRSPYRRFYLWAAMVTIAAGLGAYLYYGLPPITSYLLAITIAGFMLFGYDKSIADSNATRVPELVFVLIALVGGSVGLLVGMKLFRHKTLKASFQFVLGVVLIGQLLALRYLWGFIREAGLM